MIKKVDCLKDEQILYEYFKKISSEIPYYFPVDFNLWRESMFNEIKNGAAMFDELVSCLLYEKDNLKGFIQYGIAADKDGKYPVIRNMHYAKDTEKPEELIESGLNYFNLKDMQNITAYMQWCGMSCYAGQGKLHESQFYIEDLLSKYSFVPNESNEYFSKYLKDCNIINDSEIICEVCESNSNEIEIKFIYKGEQAGVSALKILQNGISYLIYIEIFEKHRNQGLGVRCINNIFYIMKNKNINRIDTDTYTAAGFYKKTGFVYNGIMRSYINYNE